jgi:hypothetical protein
VDGIVDIADPVRTLLVLFAGAAPSTCMAACDSNDTGVVDLSDVVYTLNWLFKAAAIPPAPGPFTCGTDASLRSFPGCAAYSRCP